jgi:hypothetical protein
MSVASKNTSRHNRSEKRFRVECSRMTSMHPSFGNSANGKPRWRANERARRRRQ